jgi:hypothetical protein
LEPWSSPWRNAHIFQFHPRRAVRELRNAAWTSLCVNQPVKENESEVFPPSFVRHRFPVMSCLDLCPVAAELMRKSRSSISSIGHLNARPIGPYDLQHSIPDETRGLLQDRCDSGRHLKCSTSNLAKYMVSTENSRVPQHATSPATFQAQMVHCQNTFSVQPRHPHLKITQAIYSAGMCSRPSTGYDSMRAKENV